MIYAFEHLTELDKKMLLAKEPFVDVVYSFEKRTHNFKTHDLSEKGIEIHKLRLYKLQDLRQGFICTDFDEIKDISVLLETENDLFKVLAKYPWIEEYLASKTLIEKIHLRTIALPISCYIAYYASNLKQLKLLDIDAICAFEKK